MIGAGAALGGACALGVLRALEEVEGCDAAAQDVLVGTSAGSVLSTLLGWGVPLSRMVERLAGCREEGGACPPWAQRAGFRRGCVRLTV